MDASTRRTPINPRSRTSVRALVAVWGILAAVGTGVLIHYEAAPGSQPTAADSWPDDTDVPRSTVVPTLVLFAHPRCPCSRATFGELERLVSRNLAPLALTVVFYQPAESTADWANTDLRTSAERIPGTTVRIDLDGREAARFGVATSGDALLYSPDGRLLFRGGITASRGHAGDNAGEATILELLEGGSAARSTTPVYGCGLDASCRAPS